MAAILTYREENRQTSALVGYALRQAKAQSYLTDANVVAATSADDLIGDVNNAIVAPGAESPSQRDSIARAIAEGAQLGDLSDARVAGAADLDALIALTWVNDLDPDTSHLGTNLVP